MSPLFIGLMLAAASPVAFKLPAGTELQYTGTLLQQTKTGATEAKSFSIYAVAIPNDDGATHLAWSLDERGGGGWAWPERFGLLAPGSTDQAKTRPMRLLHTHDGTQYPLPVRSPLFEIQRKNSRPRRRGPMVATNTSSPANGR